MAKRKKKVTVDYNYEPNGLYCYKSSTLHNYKIKESINRTDLESYFFEKFLNDLHEENIPYVYIGLNSKYYNPFYVPSKYNHKYIKQIKDKLWKHSIYRVTKSFKLDVIYYTNIYNKPFDTDCYYNTKKIDNTKYEFLLYEILKDCITAKQFSVSNGKTSINVSCNVNHKIENKYLNDHLHLIDKNDALSYWINDDIMVINVQGEVTEIEKLKTLLNSDDYQMRKLAAQLIINKIDE